MGLIFTCPDCGLTNALFPSHHAVCPAIQNMHVVTYSDVVDEYDRLRKLLADERTENERLRALLEPCYLDTDAQTDSSYPATVNDVLDLLSCYWADFLPDNVVVGDEYFAAWERQARPVIERLLARE